MTTPRATAAAFWAALYDRYWERIRSFVGAEPIGEATRQHSAVSQAHGGATATYPRTYFVPESIYYDVPTGPSSAGVGPDSIEARLRLGLEGLVGYEHRPGVVAEGGDGVVVVVTEHTEVWTWVTGETVALPFVSVQHIVDGTILLWKDYWDFQTLMDAAPATWHERLDTADLSWVVDVTGRA